MIEAVDHVTFEEELAAHEASRRHVIPPGLDEMTPGPFLAVILSSVDVDRLSAYDRIVLLRAHQRMASHYQSHVHSDIASVSDHLERDLDGDIELAADATAAEIRAALNLTRRAADNELDVALTVRRRVPAVWASLNVGDLDIARTKTIVRGTEHLPEQTARAVVETMLADAPNLTTGQIAARLRRLCIDTNPEEATTRYDHSLAHRHIEMRPNPDGTAQMSGYNLPPPRQRQPPVDLPPRPHVHHST